ncbi:lipopolysaccharide assembly protein LapB [Geobacter sp. AOG1]|uniref:tetratricopeptide repeat protein n=1 Tax=Geobacter sp. AOG1 TaxID=1566346 RepID=UPI001CC4F282|nr:tetratricopeptide repeat protein [Geobacter sp. AOG1]GFE58562.1 hypothetical protein AOG1_24420 [Geobacter sp. AOG1]
MFGRFFKRDYRYYISEGEKYLAAEHYADARTAFNEALAKMGGETVDNAALIADVKSKIALAGNRLGFVNLAEAEHAIQSGNMVKAHEHIQLVMHLAEDVTAREKAEILLQHMTVNSPAAIVAETSPGCASCNGISHKTVENSDVSEEHLSPADRFFLAVQTLPGELHQRYMVLGEKFACAYLSAHGENDDSALSLFQELNEAGENDIYHYEISLIHYRQGDLARCELHLQRALELNGTNPLCWLALAQLYVDAGRFQEALGVLDHMVLEGFLSDQARTLQGDVYQSMGAVDRSIDCYTELLASPGTARIAAERLVPLLESQGRSDEAEFLFKKYLKGCC